MEPNATSLLQAVLQSYPDTPKSRAKQWILAGRVTVNGQVVRRPHHEVQSKDTVGLGNRHATTLNCEDGWQIHPRVALLHLDSSVAIVNKGPGLISIPAADSGLSALSILADFLEGKLKPRDPSAAGRVLPAAYRRLIPLPVHRLDQYTTGVFCMATNPEARLHLIEQLKTHSMKREYVAFVEGRPKSPKGTWRHLVQLSRDEMRQNVLSEEDPDSPGSNAAKAVTHFELLQTYDLKNGVLVSKLRLRLETGLKHQIRAQAAYAGMPLIGDRMYNPRVRISATDSIVFPRQALHAEILTLEHPEQPGRKLTRRAELPKDLRQLEGALRSGRLESLYP